jgi:uncharacterized protein (DUF433 family)
MVARRQLEAERQRRVPGIAFADGVDGRVPVIAGTGIQVFEVVGVYRAANGDRALVQRAFDWLSPAQLDAALAYYAAYPEEIDRRLMEEDECFSAE